MNAVSPNLHDEVMREYIDIPNSVHGAATLIKLSHEKIRSNSHCVTVALQHSITSFNLTSVTNEDVNKVSLWLKAVLKVLINNKSLPSNTLHYTLDEMSRSAMEEHILCKVIKPQLQKSSSSASTIQSNFPILNNLANHHHDAVQAGTWPKLFHSSSTAPQFFTASL